MLHVTEEWRDLHWPHPLASILEESISARGANNNSGEISPSYLSIQLQLRYMYMHVDSY